MTSTQGSKCILLDTVPDGAIVTGSGVSGDKKVYCNGRRLSVMMGLRAGRLFNSNLLTSLIGPTSFST